MRFGCYVNEVFFIVYTKTNVLIKSFCDVGHVLLKTNF